jgi:hypothetical protein
MEFDLQHTAADFSSEIGPSFDIGTSTGIPYERRANLQSLKSLRTLRASSMMSPAAQTLYGKSARRRDFVDVPRPRASARQPADTLNNFRVIEAPLHGVAGQRATNAVAQRERFGGELVGALEIEQMLGWFSADAVRASRRILPRSAGPSPRSSRSFTAAWRSRVES